MSNSRPSSHTSSTNKRPHSFLSVDASDDGILPRTISYTITTPLEARLTENIETQNQTIDTLTANINDLRANIGDLRAASKNQETVISQLQEKTAEYLQRAQQAESQYLESERQRLSLSRNLQMCTAQLQALRANQGFVANPHMLFSAMGFGQQRMGADITQQFFQPINAHQHTFPTSGGTPPTPLSHLFPGASSTSSSQPSGNDTTPTSLQRTI